MKVNKTILLNILTIFSFIFYVIGIYLIVVLKGEEKWGSFQVDFLISALGPAIGLVMIVVFGAGVLVFTLYYERFNIFNTFLCWFWILSLYQCSDIRF